MDPDGRLLVRNELDDIDHYRYHTFADETTAATLDAGDQFGPGAGAPAPGGLGPGGLGPGGGLPGRPGGAQ